MTTRGPSSDTLQLRRGTAAEWTAANPTLSAGEVGWERDTNKVKIGDGSTAWVSLPYLAGTGVGADHGLLTGLADDDHPQYATLAQDETVTGEWTFTDDVIHANATTIRFKDSGGTIRQVLHWSAGDLLQFGSLFAQLSLFGDINFAPDGITRAFMDSNGQLTLDLANSGATRGLAFGSDEDTNLYRSSANTLKTDDDFGASAFFSATPGSQTVFVSARSGDPNWRFMLWESGLMQWGDGTLTQDTNLYRSAADILKTDDQFKAASTIVSGDGAAGQITLSLNGTLYFGSAQDTNLYRSAVDTLATDDNFVVTGNHGVYVVKAALGHNGDSFITYAAGDANERFKVKGTGLHEWGDGTAVLDTNLYRSAANTLQTDDDFYAGSTAGAYTWLSQSNGVLHYYQAEASPRFWISRDLPTAGGGASGVAFGPGGAIFPDTNLYRSAADVLKTDDSLTVSGNLLLPSGGSSQFGITNGGAIGANGLQLYYDGTNAIVGTIGVLPLRFRTDSDERMRLATATDALDFGATLKLQWGTAIGTNDTNLYRSAANVLKTDDEFSVNDNILLKPAGDIKFASTLKGGSDQIILQQDGTLLLQERAAPGAPLDTTANLYTVDSGSGKGQLVIRFPSGASQIIATEP